MDLKEDLVELVKNAVAITSDLIHIVNVPEPILPSNLKTNVHMLIKHLTAIKEAMGGALEAVAFCDISHKLLKSILKLLKGRKEDDIAVQEKMKETDTMISQYRCVFRDFIYFLKSRKNKSTSKLEWRLLSIINQLKKEKTHHQNDTTLIAILSALQVACNLSLLLPTRIIRIPSSPLKSLSTPIITIPSPDPHDPTSTFNECIHSSNHQPTKKKVKIVSPTKETPDLQDIYYSGSDLERENYNSTDYESDLERENYNPNKMIKTRSRSTPSPWLTLSLNNIPSPRPSTSTERSSGVSNSSPLTPPRSPLHSPRGRGRTSTTLSRRSNIDQSPPVSKSKGTSLKSLLNGSPKIKSSKLQVKTNGIVGLT